MFLVTPLLATNHEDDTDLGLLWIKHISHSPEQWFRQLVSASTVFMTLRVICGSKITAQRGISMLSNHFSHFQLPGFMPN